MKEAAIVDENLKEWLKSGEYLPDPIKDFHDQKELFKCLDTIASSREWVPEKPNWVSAHIYVIDIFLWFMAAHGYTLQKTRKHRDSRPTFDDLDEALKEHRDRRLQEYYQRQNDAE